MANLTITVPDAAVPRIRAAFGHFNANGPDWVPATQAELQEAIKNYVRQTLVNYEAGLAEREARTAKVTEAAAW